MGWSNLPVTMTHNPGDLTEGQSRGWCGREVREGIRTDDGPQDATGGPA